MTERLVTPDGKVWVPSDSPPPVDILPIPKPPGTVTRQGDDYAVINQDFTEGDRGSSLPETNATRPDRPTEPESLWQSFLSLLGWRVFPNGKIIVPLDKGNGPIYWQWFVDVQGAWAADKMLGDGNGYFDTASRWGFMCSPSGGDLIHILDTINQHGTFYFVVERFNVNVMPERVVEDSGTIRWFYEGRECSYELTPHLLATRTNRRLTKQKTWITWGGVNNISDASGGEEHWPLVANQVAAQPRADVRRYVRLPAEVYVHTSSLIVDGDLVTPTPGYKKVTIDALCFTGSDTAIRERGSELWFEADKLLKRIGEPYAATGFDYRCFVSLDGVTPWMGQRGYRSPVPNWKRR